MRGALWRVIPLHVGYALVSGALLGLVLYGLNECNGAAWIEFLASLAMLLCCSAFATLPMALPGKHWLFGTLAAVALMCLLLPGLLLAPHVPFAHSYVAGAQPVELINVLTMGAMISGLCLGLFYGLLVGGTRPVVVGCLAGLGTGYVLGLCSVLLGAWSKTGEALHLGNAWGWVWQCALTMGALHLVSAAGVAAVSTE